MRLPDCPGACWRQLGEGSGGSALGLNRLCWRATRRLRQGWWGFAFRFRGQVTHSTRVEGCRPGVAIRSRCHQASEALGIPSPARGNRLRVDRFGNRGWDRHPIANGAEDFVSADDLPRGACRTRCFRGNGKLGRRDRDDGECHRCECRYGDKTTGPTPQLLRHPRPNRPIRLGLGRLPPTRSRGRTTGRRGGSAAGTRGVTAAESRPTWSAPRSGWAGALTWVECQPAAG